MSKYGEIRRRIAFWLAVKAISWLLPIEEYEGEIPVILARVGYDLRLFCAARREADREMRIW